jgi:hypothetical protein
MKKFVVVLQCVTLFSLCGTWVTLEVASSYPFGQSLCSLAIFLLGTAGLCLLIKGKPSKGKKSLSVFVSVVKNLASIFFQLINLCFNAYFPRYPVRSTFIVAAFSMLVLTFLTEIIYIVLWKKNIKG